MAFRMCFTGLQVAVRKPGPQALTAAHTGASEAQIAVDVSAGARYFDPANRNQLNNLEALCARSGHYQIEKGLGTALRSGQSFYVVMGASLAESGPLHCMWPMSPPGILISSD